MKAFKRTTAFIIATAFAVVLTLAVTADFSAPATADAASTNSKVEYYVIDEQIYKTEEFGSVADAWNKAKSLYASYSFSNVKLILGADWEHDEQLVIEHNKYLTIDLNGHYIRRTRNKVQTKNGSVFRIEENAQLTVKDSRPNVKGFDGVKGGVITGGASTNGGGGIHIEDHGHVVWEGGTLYACVTDEDGGGVYLDGSSDSTSFTMTGGKIYACQTIDSSDNCYGGAIFCKHGSVTLRNATIDDCYSEDSGGACFIRDGSFSAYDTVFSANHTLDDGGAIYLDGDALISFRNCIFAGNKADDRGGAVYIDNNPPEDKATIFDSCQFRNNYAGDRGGALFIDDDNVALISVTIQNNTALKKGGGVWVNNQSDITFKGKCIVKDNTCIENSDYRNVTLERWGAAKAYVWSAGLYAGSYIGINSDASSDDILISPKMSMYQLQYFHADAGQLVMRDAHEEEAPMVVTASLFGNGIWWVAAVIGGVGVAAAVFVIIYRKKKLAKAAATVATEGAAPGETAEQVQNTDEEDD